MNRLKTLAITLAASLLAAAPAHANSYTIGQTIEVSKIGTGKGQNVSITTYNTGSGTDTTLGTHSVFAGVIKLTIGGAVVDAFCVDPFQWATPGKDYKVAALSSAPLAKPMGAADASLIGKLWDKYFEQSLTNNTVAATLQVAIWKLTGDNLFKLNNNNTLNNAADAYIAAAGQHTGKASLVALTKVNGQDFVVRQVPDGGTTVLLLGLGLSGLALMRRRVA